MQIAFLDCFAGIAGDMFLGALLDAGVPAEVLHEATAALNIGASLRIERVDRSGISCTKVHVLDRGHLAESDPDHPDFPDHLAPTLQHHPKTQHQHKGGHTHTHDHPHSHDDEPSHGHTHGRSLSEIRTLIRAAPLGTAVKQTAIRAFELLGASEAKIHNVPVDSIHFHEVGAVDAIVDIVACSAGIHHLNIGAWHCSAVNVGGGMVQCAHGNFPVPAPATADLLRDVPTYSAHMQKELTTPTGAALLRALEPSFGPQPAMRVERIGYGAGTRNPAGFPNALRLAVGESAQMTFEPNTETVILLECALDDQSPQVIAYVAEQALTMGALDVMLMPVLMKKGRPGTLLTVLCHAPQRDALQQLILRETTTLGLRVREEKRIVLERSLIPVETAYGIIRVKLASDSGAVRNVAPEFEDCRSAAAQHNVPLKQVQQAAIAAFLARS